MQDNLSIFYRMSFHLIGHSKKAFQAYKLIFFFTTLDFDRQNQNLNTYCCATTDKRMKRKK